MKPSGAGEEFEFINALRGLAATSVYFFHVIVHILWNDPSQIVPGNLTWTFIHHDFNLGRYAVSVFFLVSGFLIPSTLRKPGATLKAFTIHRFFRLYPAYWLSILVFIPVNLIHKGDLGASPKVVLVNLTMFQRFVGIDDYIGAFWTLQIELIFYVLCGLLFALGLLIRRRTALALACLAMVATAWLREETGRSLPVAVPLALSLMALADMIRACHYGEFSLRELAGWVLLVCSCLVPACLWAYGDFGWGAVLSNWAAVATFLLAYRLRDLFVRAKPLRWMGKFFGDISYSFYLLHSAIGLHIAYWTREITGSFPFAVVAGFLVTTAISSLAYRFVELPGIRLGRSLTRVQRTPAAHVDESTRVRQDN